MSLRDTQSQTLPLARPHILFIFNAFLTHLLHIIHPTILTLLMTYVKIPHGSGAKMGGLGVCFSAVFTLTIHARAMPLMPCT